MLVLVEGGITLSLKAILGQYSSLSSRPDPVEDRFSADCLDVLRSAQAWHLNESVLSLMLGQRTSVAASCKVIGGSLAASVCKFLVEAANQDGWPLLVQRLPSGEQLAHGSLWHDHSMLLELLQTLHLQILIRGKLPENQLAHILEFASACEGNPGIFIGKAASGLASLIRTGEQDPGGWQR